MAKLSSSASFKNFRFRVSEDENGKERIIIQEETKDDTIYTEFQDVLDMFEGREGLTMTIKYDSEFGE